MDPAKASQIKITQLGTAKGAIHRPLGTNDLVEQLALRVPNPNILGSCAINVTGPVHAHSIGSLEVGLTIVHFGKELLSGQSSVLADLERQDLFRNVFGHVKSFLIGAQDQPIGGLHVGSNGLGFALRGNVNDFTRAGQGKIDPARSVDDQVIGFPAFVLRQILLVNERPLIILIQTTDRSRTVVRKVGFSMVEETGAKALFLGHHVPFFLLGNKTLRNLGLRIGHGQGPTRPGWTVRQPEIIRNQLEGFRPVDRGIARKPACETKGLPKGGRKIEQASFLGTWFFGRP